MYLLANSQLVPKVLLFSNFDGVIYSQVPLHPLADDFFQVRQGLASVVPMAMFFLVDPKEAAGPQNGQHFTPNFPYNHFKYGKIKQMIKYNEALSTSLLSNIPGNICK